MKKELKFFSEHITTMTFNQVFDILGANDFDYTKPIEIVLASDDVTKKGSVSHVVFTQGSSLIVKPKKWSNSISKNKTIIVYQKRRRWLRNGKREKRYLLNRP